jgi:HEAT repeat protein
MGMLFLVAVWFALLACASYGQVGPAPPSKIADAIEKVKQGNFSFATIEQIAEARAVDAIPVLKEQSARSNDDDTKAKIASALVRLGDKDDGDWDLLLKQATLAVKSDAPPLVKYDTQGKAIRGQPSIEFSAWAKSHNMSVESAAESAEYGLPIKLGFLAETGDTRGIPLLRQALQSPNYLVAAMAARGLAQAQDEGSVSLIVETCRKAPADAATAIAGALVFFDDPQAQSAVDIYLPREYARASRDARAQGKGPFGH